MHNAAPAPEKGRHDLIVHALAAMDWPRPYARYVMLAPGGGYYTADRVTRTAGHVRVLTVAANTDPTVALENAR